MENNKFLRHQKGCRACEECIAGYPTLCNCGGLIHAEYVVKEEKDYIVLARDKMNNGSYRGLICIPKVCIL